MKKTLFIVALVLLSAGMFAQGHGGFIGISIGPSFPIGDFGDNTPTNTDAGYAKTGLNINLLNFGYKLGPNVGIAANWFGGAHTVDNNNPDVMWSYGSLMGGLFLALPVNNKTELDIKGTVGYTTAKLDLKQLGEYTGNGFGYAFGAMLRHDIASRWCLLLQADYFATKPEFKGRLGIVTVKKNISAINANLGIAYKLK